MFISKAFAASGDNVVHLDALSEAPSAFGAFMTNIGLLLVLMLLFYVLLILPQQRRFKEHSKMLSELKKGDRVVTGGGLVGKIEKVINDDEVLVDLGNDVKVTALRATLQGKSDAFLKPAKEKPAAPAEKPKAAKEKKAKDDSAKA